MKSWIVNTAPSVTYTALQNPLEETIKLNFYSPYIESKNVRT